MKDFKVQIIALIEQKISALKDKIQIGAVDAETEAPYAVINAPIETAIRTIHGIAGYDTTFDLLVFHNKLSECETLKNQIVDALESKKLDTKTCLYKSSEYSYFHELNIHGYTLTFKII